VRVTRRSWAICNGGALYTLVFSLHLCQRRLGLREPEGHLHGLIHLDRCRQLGTELAHLYNLVPYQRRPQRAGQCGVEAEGGRVPTGDWFLNLQILTAGGFR
jgi:hypothetical protein